MKETIDPHQFLQMHIATGTFSKAFVARCRLLGLRTVSDLVAIPVHRLTTTSLLGTRHYRELLAVLAHHQFLYLLRI